MGKSAARFHDLTVKSALSAATATLAEAGVDNAAGDARRLLAHVLGIPHLDLIREPAKLLTDPDADRLSDLLARRRRHEPVSRIIGTRGFYGREFVISPATLDPRPDTETLVDVALPLARDIHRSTGRCRILDIGTGSGAILLTLLAELPYAIGVGTDISAGALATAARNAESLGVADRVSWHEGRTFGGTDGVFDLVVANPPYIPSGDIAVLAPDVRDYDPLMALDGGVDGLDVYRDIAAGLRTSLPRGAAVVEVGHGQATAVAELLGAVWPPIQLNRVWITDDLGGVARCVAVATHF